MRANQIFIIFMGFCFGALAAIWLYAMENQPGRVKTESVGQALIGGPFTLSDQNGTQKSDTDFAGRYMLVYFGYTYCPDICPTDLSKMTRTLEMLDKERAAKVQPIFITVDPERDTPEQLKDYLSNFHPRMIGLTGPLEEIEKTKKAYKVYAVKVDADGKTGNDIKGDSYLMDHSPQTFLMGPDGKFLRFFRFSETAPQIAATLKKLIPAESSNEAK